MAINDRSNQLRGEGKEIFKLGLGESPFPLADPVVEALQESANERLDRHIPRIGDLRPYDPYVRNGRYAGGCLFSCRAPFRGGGLTSA